LFGGNNDRNNSNVISLVIGVVIIIVAPLIASIIQMAISRQREYLADATGALTTRDSEGMASALGKLRDYGRPMQRQHSSTANLFLTNPLESGWFARLFSSHPPLDDRIARLHKNAEKF
jgi:heat shock protein HtpX